MFTVADDRPTSGPNKVRAVGGGHWWMSGTGVGPVYGGTGKVDGIPLGANPGLALEN